MAIFISCFENLIFFFFFISLTREQVSFEKLLKFVQIKVLAKSLCVDNKNVWRQNCSKQILF